MDITLRVDMSALRIGTKAPADFRRNNRKLLWFLEALTRCNVLWLQGHPETPGIYKAGVRYRQESNAEAWLDIPHIMELGWGDCEDLAAWRTAELRMQGVKAKCYLQWFHQPEQGFTLYHVQVKLPDGSIEDPSKKLGMRGSV